MKLAGIARLGARLAVMALVCGNVAWAADFKEPETVQEIIRALKPADDLGPTRGLSGLGDQGDSRGISFSTGSSGNKSSGAPAAADFEIGFEFNSSRLTGSAETKLRRIGEALQSGDLAPYGFEIAGHTDAVGSDTYNDSLSRRRAEVVVDFLVQNYGIATRRLSSQGYGESRLRDSDAPNSSVNRRVEVKNLGRL